MSGLVLTALSGTLKLPLPPGIREYGFHRWCIATECGYWGDGQIIRLETGQMCGIPKMAEAGITSKHRQHGLQGTLIQQWYSIIKSW